MEKILLISVDDIKENTSISRNITPEYLRPALLQAQEEGLQSIVGECLYIKLQEVAKRAINRRSEPEDKPYLNLLDECFLYLVNLSVSNVLPRVSFKVANMGVESTDDERARQVSRGDMVAQRDFYKNQVDVYCRLFQNYLLRHKDEFPELCDCDCNRIKANLDSSATCGLWLGGRRGRK